MFLHLSAPLAGVAAQALALVGFTEVVVLVLAHLLFGEAGVLAPFEPAHYPLHLFVERQVPIQVALVLELCPAATNMALVLLHVGPVRQLVLCKLARVHEGSVAVTAFVGRPSLLVNNLVARQGTLVSKALLTRRTLHDFLMIIARVFVQLFSRVKAEHAAGHRALETSTSTSAKDHGAHLQA